MVLGRFSDARPKTHPLKPLRAAVAAIATTYVGATLLITTGGAQGYKPLIPRTWDDAAVESFHLPLAQRDRSPRFMRADSPTG